MSTVIDLAWAAGLFEGEGCVCLTKRQHAEATLSSTDEDVLLRFADIVGVGHVRGPVAPTGVRKKEFWEWRVSGYWGVSDLFEMIGPQLGVRRTDKFESTLAVARHRGRGKVAA